MKPPVRRWRYVLQGSPGCQRAFRSTMRAVPLPFRLKTLNKGQTRRSTRSTRSTRDVWLPALMVVATVAAFWPVVGNQLVNWDDPDVLVKNAQLAGPGIVRWAFTTDLIGHYQPLSWLIWSALKSAFGLSARAFHGLSLTAHLLNGLLVFILTFRLARAGKLSDGRARIVAAVACFTFALHP